MIGRRRLLQAGGLTAGMFAIEAGPAASAGASPVAGGTSAAAGSVGCGGPIKSASILPVDDCDGMDRILAKAAHIVPRPSQVAWQQREVTAFTHFGMNTFTNREWGSGMEDETRFAPTLVDVEQWMRTYKAMGARQAMLTAKHHDGFVLYPSRYTPHSVAASAWDGDLLGSYVTAARAAGLKVGVYLSPADGAELPHEWFANTYVPAILAKPADQRSTNERATIEDLPGAPRGLGRYGNGSAIVRRTIPTLVDGDDRADRVAQGKLPTFEVEVDDYNAYYLNQVYEIFTEYGPIDEFWLDGANPWSGSGITEKYDFTLWFKLIHELSPETVTFAGPQGTRWVGNEDGSARTTEWSVVADSQDPATTHGEGILIGGAQANDLGSRLVLADPSVRYLQWFPAEADVSLRPGWFYHPTESPKTASQLVSIYQHSVGRNALLLLNVPPAPDGRIATGDVASLTSFAASVRETYATNLLAGNARHSDDKAFTSLTDDRLDTVWEPPDGSVVGTVTLDLARSVTFDQIRLGEDITRGQLVEQFSVDTWDGAAWVRAVAGTTIGYRRILVLAAPLTTDRLRVHILAARSTPHLASVGLFRTTPPA
ncbi:MAG TPA: alpha-L-fucosidase [Actinopolymorphaceae bacterium]|nr:alpha-L-fucosidase [Actinopolymorphaceae bacterium]